MCTADPEGLAGVPDPAPLPARLHRKTRSSHPAAHGMEHHIRYRCRNRQRDRVSGTYVIIVRSGIKFFYMKFHSNLHFQRKSSRNFPSFHKNGGDHVHSRSPAGKRILVQHLLHLLVPHLHVDAVRVRIPEPLACLLPARNRGKAHFIVIRIFFETPVRQFLFRVSSHAQPSRDTDIWERMAAGESEIRGNNYRQSLQSGIIRCLIRNERSVRSVKNGVDCRASRQY